MSILEGALAAEFYSALSAIYSDATLTRITLTEADPVNDPGTLTPTPSNQAIKAQLDDLTESQRIAAGYGNRDVRILVLRQGVVEMDSDCQITLYGVAYSVSQCRSDPAGAYWELRCTKR